MDAKVFAVSPWKRLLKTVGENLMSEDIQGIIFILQIPDGIVQKIDSDGILLLNELERRGHINEIDIENLEEILKLIQRNDLLKYVDNFRNEGGRGARVSIVPDERKGKQKIELKKPSHFAGAKKKQNKSYEVKHEGAASMLHSNFSKNNEKQKKDDVSHVNVKSTENTYIKDTSCKGLCIIISNYKFSDKGGDKEEKQNDKCTTEKAEDDSNKNLYREGTQLDEKDLEDTFLWLNFDVEKLQDCTASEILQNLQSVAERDFDKYSALVYCILSHGDEDGIYGTDWKIITKDKIRSTFKGDKCRQLVGKPKLFFIQACRGRGIDPGAIVTSKAPQQSDEPSFKSESIEEERDTCSNLQFDLHPSLARKPSGSNKKDSSGIIPLDSDFLFAYGTTPGNISIRDMKKGTWFISALCEVLKEKAHEEDLLSVLTEVTNRVSKQTAYQKGRFKTAPEHSNNLRMKLYFKPETTWEFFCREQVTKKSQPFPSENME